MLLHYTSINVAFIAHLDLLQAVTELLTVPLHFPLAIHQVTLGHYLNNLNFVLYTKRHPR